MIRFVKHAPSSHWDSSLEKRMRDKFFVTLHRRPLLRCKGALLQGVVSYKSNSAIAVSGAFSIGSPGTSA